MTSIIKILCLPASPVDTGQLRLDEEVRQISQNIDLGSARDRFELILHWAPKLDDLQRVLMKHQPHIVHFSGHGSHTEEIMLEDSTGKSKKVRGQELAEIFRRFRDNVRIVVLNGCYSNAQAEALSGAVDYIIGTNKAIGDRAAVTFASAFYRALAFERTVEESFELARAELSLTGISGANIPGIFIREDVDATEPFLNQKDIGQKNYLRRLNSSLGRVMKASSSENDRRLIRQSIADGRLVLEPLDSAEVEADVINTIDITSMTETESVRVQVNTSTYQRIQEQLYPPPPGIPPPLPGLLFIGRDNALYEVKQLLGVGDKVSPTRNPIVVRGWPGVGKTTLASMIGRDPEVYEAFPDGVLWASLEQSPELLSTLATMGRALGTEDLLRAHTLNDATIRLANLLHDKRMLIIVDGVWESADALPFLRACADSKSALLITTRLTSVAEDLGASEGSIYVLPVLTEDSALKLLRALVPSIVEAYPDECRELVRDLEYLPLALHVAGRLLRTEAKLGLNVKDLIVGIREGILSPEPAPIDRAEGTTIPSLFEPLLRRSTDHLDKSARDCFALLGVFAPKPATFNLAAMSAVWEVQDPKSVVRELVGHGLLEPVGTGRFQMHAIFVRHARSLLT